MDHSPTFGTRQHKTRSGRMLSFTELGLGTAPIGNLYRAIDEETAQQTLQAGWDAGCRLFDTAPFYGLGLAETRLNHFLRGKKRESYLLSTKIGRVLKVCAPENRAAPTKFFDTPSREVIFDYSYDGVLRALEQSLERLGVDRIDILLCHDVDISTHGTKAASDARIAEFMKGGYAAMLRLREEGVVSAIGAGLNEWQVCETLARAGDFDLFLMAGRYTLLEQESLTSFLPLCEHRNIAIMLGGPYNSGILATGARPGAYYDYEPAPPAIMERVARLERVCAAHGVALPEAALRFPLGHKCVVSIIPGGQNAAEVQRNAAVLGATIPAALWQDLVSEGLVRPDAPLPA
jgi:D-threo-aldose 1-dehydrogenase